MGKRSFKPRKKYSQASPSLSKRNNTPLFQESNLYRINILFINVFINKTFIKIFTLFYFIYL